ncbi:hypothetical protein QN277_029467 [Acacia crassicarpa]|uniref:Thioredoxin domain-containing protein n=1 Tax=Acacia crassicarpa TaxID=499986 RepID=A0AAE1J888_9FABA|nr:hypothetical protein QN277_029467 [Acacia crassicarpa]
MKLLIVLLASILLSFLSAHGASSASVEWQILTKQNFSSQIRIHPHILLLVTLPWSGESRSLMKDVALVVAGKTEDFGPLKLRYMHRNTEKMLADSIGAHTEETTLIYFHYSISYKYRGRLTAKNILSSLHPYIMSAPEEVPLKALKDPEELRMFLDSTDKALVLVDFCGWTTKLLAKQNGTEISYSMHGDKFGAGFSGKHDRTLASKGKNNLKVAGEGMCKAELSISNGFGVVPWLGTFISMNDSVLEEANDSNSHVLPSCTLQEFEHFHYFYSKFMAYVREFFLPPERHRFGLVSERSILSSLGVRESRSWFAVLYVDGCPSCLKVLKEEDDLKHALHVDNYFVKELEGKGQDQETILPANKPSVLLFVDRSSDTSETRGKSKEALNAFRELAQHYHVLNQIGKKDNGSPEKFSILDYLSLKSVSEHPRLKLSKTAQKIKLKEKMSTIMVINEGKHVSLDKVTSDIQVTSLNEILGYLLQKNKDGRLSSLAKDLGFQLLSDDIDIKPIHAEQSHSEVLSNPMPAETSHVGHTDSSNPDNDPNLLSRSAEDPEENSKLAELSYQDEVMTSRIDSVEEIKSTKLEESLVDHELLVTKNMKAEKEGSLDEDNSEKESIADNEFPVAKNMKAEKEGGSLDGDNFEKESIADSKFPVAKNMKMEIEGFSGGHQPGQESNVAHELSGAKNLKAETDTYSDGDKFGEELDQFLGFNGSFFYSECNYQLLKVLTGNFRIPTLVIVDPVQQQHYVFPKDQNFNFSSLNGFLSGFVNDTLLPHQRSEHVFRGPREATRPPFVNLDFHEVDSLPRITAYTFSELAIGFNHSDKDNAWNKDVLVLFSHSWCGYCQRMEMVVREVHRAFKGYMDILKSGSRNMKAISDHENLDHDTITLPVIYLLDCTLNDCDLILKSVNQRELYPTLVLFPAEKKKPLLYEGDIAVIDVIKFVAENASYFNRVISDKVLRLPPRGDRNQNVYSTLAAVVHKESLHDRNLDNVVKLNLMKPPVPNRPTEALPQVIIGSVLIATEKLLGIQPFDGSKILIVAADQISGFQGVIINKHIEWSSLPELGGGFEILKEAPLSFGGPVVKSGMPFLCLTRNVSVNSLPEILPGVYFLDHLATMSKIEEMKSEANQSIVDHWFFLGYSSWDWNQLFNEIAQGAWNLSEDGKRHWVWP